MRHKHDGRHVWAGVAPFRHAAWHLGGVVAPCMNLEHTDRHVEHEVPPRIRPEPYGTTLGLPDWLLSINTHDPTSFIHIQTCPKQVKKWEKVEKENKSFRDFSRVLESFRSHLFYQEVRENRPEAKKVLSEFRSVQSSPFKMPALRFG